MEQGMTMTPPQIIRRVKLVVASTSLWRKTENFKSRLKLSYKHLEYQKSVAED
jgi:hypothetical protein